MTVEYLYANRNVKCIYSNTCWYFVSG